MYLDLDMYYLYDDNHSRSSSDSIKVKRLVERLNKIKLEGKGLKSTKLFYKLLRKKQLRQFSDSSSQQESAIRLSNQFDKMLSILKHKFEENWDIFLHPYVRNGEVKYEIGFAILYPEIEIFNSYDESHTIKDLIVYISLLENTESGRGEIGFGNIKGTRATLSDSEFRVGYLHSHLHPYRMLPHNVLLNATDFCLGEGELGTFIINSYSDPDYVFDEIHFESFLYLIDTLVEWESLEGTPYIKFSKIWTESSGDSAPTIPNADLGQHIVKDLVYGLINFLNSDSLRLLTFLSSLEYVISENRYKIKDTKKVNETLVEMIVESGFFTSSDLARTVVTGDSKYSTYFKGYVKTVEPTPISIEHITNPDLDRIPQIILGNKVIPFSLVEDSFKEEEEETIPLSAYFIHPVILTQLFNHYEQRLYAESVRQSAI